MLVHQHWQNENEHTLYLRLQDPLSGDSAIFVQRVLPGSPAETCNLLDSGDQILAIDGQLLDGADFLMCDIK